MNFSIVALAVLGKQASAPDPPQHMPVISGTWSRLSPERRHQVAAPKIQAEVKITKQYHPISLKLSPPSATCLSISPNFHCKNLHSAKATFLYFMSDTFGHLYDFQEQKKLFLLLQWFYSYPHVKWAKGSAI